MGSTDKHQRGDSPECPLPGTAAVWRKCGAGPPSQWDEVLKAHAITISSFSYPSAIFWGENFVLLHNKAWAGVKGLDQQGASQRGRLHSDTWKCLQNILRGGQPQHIAANDLLLNGRPSDVEYLVLMSPLFARDDRPTGVLAQLLPKPTMSNPSTSSRKAPIAKRSGTTDTANDTNGGSDNGNPSLSLQQFSDDDNLALDEHPFFHRFAEMLPSGLAILDHEAHAVFVNQHFYDLTTHKGEDQSFKAWPDSIHPDDKQRVLDAYQEAFHAQKQLRTEFRALAEGSHPWRLLLLNPLGDDNLKHVSLRDFGGFVCSIVDINSEKSAELAERKAAKEAEERKTVLTNFIDMVSHEIRNPLSAVLHCSEDISEALESPTPDVETIREAVETINVCISHQKNIVDDVLSFSKLDASMLALAPSPCQPEKYFSDSLKMFVAEFRKQHLDFSYHIHDSYKDLNVTWVMADMARVCQVLINLVTNAIKFTTKSKGEKSVKIMVGASKDRPTSCPQGQVDFTHEELSYRMNATNTAGWGQGEVVYITVAVRDTGIGINEDAQKHLFGRWAQATPKTSEQYGGSGLGLNISKKLCQLHGGEIAVSSKEGEGSTFSFYFKTVRTDPPQEKGESQNQDAEIEHRDLKESIQSRGNAEPGDYSKTTLPDSESRPDEKDKDKSGKRPKDPDRIQSRHQDDGGDAAKIDAFSNAERPDVSPAHRQGEYMQSEDVTSPDPPSISNNDSPHRSSNTSLTRKRSKPHILLVEDNIINQRIVFRKLQAKGFHVTTANNGREAVSAVREASNPSSGGKAAYDIILMDNEMPVLDGNRATQQIRELEENGAFERIPILGVTASARGAQQDEMLGNGMDDVIAKPYRIADIIEKINRLTGGMNEEVQEGKEEEEEAKETNTKS